MSGARVRSDAAPEHFFDSKLHPPSARTPNVARAALVERLARSDAPISSIVAPAGYGKTTLLAQWAERDPERVAWLSLDRHDNDLAQFVSYTAAALSRVGPVDPHLFRPSGPRRSVTRAAAQITRALADLGPGVVLVLDHVEAVEDDECRDAIGEIALHLPDGARLALATRGRPPVPIPRLRADGAVIEVGAADLAMTDVEAATLLARNDVDVTDAELEGLVQRTEGWPAALYLTALALKAGGSRESVAVACAGDDLLVAEYLRSEVLAALSDDQVSFLTRTSVLDRMSGGLCDAVLEATGSSAVLESLANANLFMVPLDRRGEWYRCRHLFRDLLRAELERREPDAIPVLHERAADWYEQRGLRDLAMEHAQAAGDPDRVNRLFLVHAGRAYAEGHASSVRRWAAWIEGQGHLEEHPAAAVLGALMFSGLGDAGAADTWAAAAEHGGRREGERDGADGAWARRAADDRILPDGSTLAAWRAALRISATPNGVDALRRDAKLALAELGPTSGYQPLALIGLALAHLLDGDPEAADPLLERATVDALHSTRIPGAVVAISERGLLAAAEGRWDDAEHFSAHAIGLVDEWCVEEYTESALAFALAARVAVRQGDAVAARAFLARAARLRPILTYARPVISVQTLCELARAYAALADTSGAREVLRQAQGIVRQRPQLGTLAGEVADLRTWLDEMRIGVIGVSSLTAAELRLVPFLPTHLTYREIAERLFLSRNTVKTHSISIYQKLGVSSRGEAIGRLRELGLLDA